MGRGAPVPAGCNISLAVGDATRSELVCYNALKDAWVVECIIRRTEESRVERSVNTTEITLPRCPPPDKLPKGCILKQVPLNHLPSPAVNHLPREHCWLSGGPDDDSSSIWVLECPNIIERSENDADIAYYSLDSTNTPSALCPSSITTKTAPKGCYILPFPIPAPPQPADNLLVCYNDTTKVWKATCFLSSASPSLTHPAPITARTAWPTNCRDPDWVCIRQPQLDLRSC